MSSIIHLAKATSSAAGGITGRGTWSITFDKNDIIKFFGVAKGSCWIELEGRKKPIHLKQGSLVLLSGKIGYRFSSAVGARTLKAKNVFTSSRKTFAHLGDRGEPEVEIVAGHTILDRVNGEFFANSLPHHILIDAVASESKDVFWLIEKLTSEYKAQTPGAEAVCAQLSQLIFLQMLRASLSVPKQLNVGWLLVASDPRLAEALRFMHHQPERKWDVEELAKAVSMSRSAFIDAFKKAAGLPPLKYLTEWRMNLAKRALVDDHVTIAELAESLGYGSESSFSHAFTRVVGCSPVNFKKRMLAKV